MPAAHAEAPVLSQSVDAIADSVQRLERFLPQREDAAVMLDFLEDDLREGLDAVAELESHFNDILDAVGADKPKPIRLLEAADDYRVLNRLEYLTVIVSQLRKRLSQAAGVLKNG
ncbi:MAG: hypothetical protein JNG84_14465 [Archangium sp.]|nr:hypothetical protein [Archangium sp.]